MPRQRWGAWNEGGLVVFDVGCVDIVARVTLIR